MVMEWPYVLTPILILFAFVALALVIFFFILWIAMIVNCLTRGFKEGSERIAWLLVLIFLPVIGAIIYYFMVFRKKLKRR